MLAVVQQGEQRAHISVGKKKKTVPGNVIHLSIRSPIHLLKRQRGAGSNPGEARAAEGDLGQLVTGLTHLDKQPSAIRLRRATASSEQPGG